MRKDIPFYVVFDANIWVAERLLQSSLGSAALFALTGAHALIGLPEVVETEVKSVLSAHAEKAVEDFRKQTELLRQLSGQRTTHDVPTSQAIQEGMERRWAELGGILKRIPFSLEQAKAALRRVVHNIPPSGTNNEQFRDCCVWEATLELSAECTVHLVSNDSAFYEGRDRGRGLLAESLREELAQTGKDVRVYSSVRDFLGKMERALSLDEATITEAIVQAVTPRVHEIVAKRAPRFELGGLSRTHISGFATPKPSVVAVSFQLHFELTLLETEEDNERMVDAVFWVGGSCSYDPNLKDVSEIEIKEWAATLPKSRSQIEYHGSIGQMVEKPGRHISRSGKSC